MEPYTYSMTILLIATCLTIILSIGLSSVYLLVSSKIKKGIESCLILIESVPDLLLILVYNYLLYGCINRQDIASLLFMRSMMNVPISYLFFV